MLAVHARGNEEARPVYLNSVSRDAGDGPHEPETEKHMSLNIGRVCVKLAGRDAGQIAVIVDVLDKNIVVIDGQVRRRKCNILHLEPTAKSVQVAKDASHNTVVAALKHIGIEVVERKTKKQKSVKPSQKRVGKPAAKAAPAAMKAAPKTAAPAAKPVVHAAKPAEHKPIPAKK